MEDSATGDSGTNRTPVTEVLALARSLARRPENLVDPWVLSYLALRAVPRARSCGISVIREGAGPETLAATDPEVSEVDQLQRALAEGPVVEAAHTPGAGPWVVHDVSADARWPGFGPRCARRTGIHAALVTTLELSSHDVAAVAHYSPDAGAFDDVESAGVRILAPFVALTIESGLPTADASRLRSALAANHRVGTATGILMARHAATSAEPFRMLRTASEELDRELHDVAREVMETGRLPSADRSVAPGQAVTPGPRPHVTR